MSLALYMNPKVPPVSWEEFSENLSVFENSYAIALDGYVNGPPVFDAKFKCANFDHHSGVCRFGTRSTCGQVYYAIKQGIFSCLKSKDGELHINVFANHCDEDVCLSWFLLKWHFPQIIERPALARLVHHVDLIDSSSGSFPVEKKIWEEIAWIFQPYREFRISGEIDKQDSISYLKVVEAVEARIMRYIFGKGKSIPIDTRYELLAEVELAKSALKCVVVKEVGPQARIGIAQNGIPAYISVRVRPDDRWTDTIGRTSPFLPINLFAAYDALNKVEENPDEKWGGGTDVGGSPRVKGTKLSPFEVAHVIANAC